MAWHLHHAALLSRWPLCGSLWHLAEGAGAQSLEVGAACYKTLRSFAPCMRCGQPVHRIGSTVP